MICICFLSVYLLGALNAGGGETEMSPLWGGGALCIVLLNWAGWSGPSGVAHAKGSASLPHYLCGEYVLCVDAHRYIATYYNKWTKARLYIYEIVACIGAPCIQYFVNLGSYT